MPDKSPRIRDRTSVSEGRRLVLIATTQVSIEILDGCRDENPGQRFLGPSEYAPVFKTGAPACPGGRVRFPSASAVTCSFARRRIVPIRLS